MRRTSLLLLMTTSVLTACSATMDRLEEVGRKPEFSKVENPHTRPEYQPMSWPMPASEPESEQYANSLWRPGSRSFFRDQRASRTGDLLRVNIEINERSEMINETRLEKNADDSVNVPGLFGGFRDRVLPGARDEPLIGIEQESEAVGRAQLRRQERINTQVAAIVTQVLPNGNLVIDGSQEILVNFEIRQVGIKGIVRPEDIRSDNTIDHSQIAEARITYSGKGQVTNVQQPRWGYQVIDAISPF